MPDDPSQPRDPGVSRRRFVGSAVAAGAAIVWTSQFPFADAAIGQTLSPHTGPTGPTGPTGTSAGSGGASGPSAPTGAAPVPGATGTAGAQGASGASGPAAALAFTGSDSRLLGALGAATTAIGGAILWLRRRGGQAEDVAGEAPGA